MEGFDISFKPSYCFAVVDGEVWVTKGFANPVQLQRDIGH